MIAVYADTSAVIGAYVADEPAHDVLAEIVFHGGDAVVTSELTRVELAAAVAAAVRGGRLARTTGLLDRFDADCGDGGPLVALRFDAAAVLPLAHRLVGEHRLRTSAALHLAVALTGATGLADEVELLTCDPRQAEVAAALGLRVRARAVPPR